MALQSIINLFSTFLSLSVFVFVLPHVFVIAFVFPSFTMTSIHFPKLWHCPTHNLWLLKIATSKCIAGILGGQISSKYHWPEMPSFPASVLKFSFNACRVIWKSGIMEICQGVTDHPVGMSATDIGESCFDLFPSSVPPFNLIFVPFCHPCL